MEGVCFEGCVEVVVGWEGGVGGERGGRGGYLWLGSGWMDWWMDGWWMDGWVDEFGWIGGEWVGAGICWWYSVVAFGYGYGYGYGYSC